MKTSKCQFNPKWVKKNSSAEKLILKKIQENRRFFNTMKLTVDTDLHSFMAEEIEYFRNLA